MTVGVIWRKPVLTHASIVCEDMLASVNSVNLNSLAGFKWKLHRHLPRYRQLDDLDPLMHQVHFKFKFKSSYHKRV